MANLEQYLSKNAGTIQKIQQTRGTTPKTATTAGKATTGKTATTKTTAATPSASTSKPGILSKIGDTLKNLWEAGTTPTSGQFIWQSAAEAKNVYTKLADPKTHAAEQARVDKLQADAKAEAEKIYLDEYKRQMDWAQKNIGIIGTTAVRAGHEFITGLSGLEPPDISTGNKIADVISSIIGQGAGFITGAALLGGQNIAAAAGAKAAGVLGLDATKALAGKIVQSAIKEGIQGSMLAGVHSVINADTPKEAMQRAKDYGLMGLIGGGGGKLLGETGSALIQSIKKNPKAWEAFTTKQTKAAGQVKLKAPEAKVAPVEKAVTTEAAPIKPTTKLKAPDRTYATDLTPTAAELERAGVRPKAAAGTAAPTEKLKAPAGKAAEPNKEALDELQAVLQGGKPSAKFNELMSEITSKPESYPETIVKAAQAAMEKQKAAPKLKVPKGTETKTPAEAAPTREKFNEKTLGKLDDLKEKYVTDKKAVEKSNLSEAEKEAKLKEMADQYKKDRNKIIYGTEEAPPKKLKGAKEEAPAAEAKAAEVKTEVKAEAKPKAAPKKMSATEKIAKKMEIQMQEKIIKDPKSTKAQVQEAQMRIDDLRAQLEVGEEIFPYDPQKIEDILAHPEKYTPEEITAEIKKVRKHVNSPDKATKTALEYSKKYMKEFQSQGYKEAKVSEYKLKSPAEQQAIIAERAAKTAERQAKAAEREALKPTGTYEGKPTREITKADIPKEDWRKFRNKYASEEENVKIFRANILGDDIMKKVKGEHTMPIDEAKYEGEQYLKSIGSEAVITPEMTQKEIGNLVIREGVKDANKKMIEKLVKENPEFIQKGKAPEGWVAVTKEKSGRPIYSAPNDYIAQQLKPLVDDGWMQEAIDAGTKMGKAWRIMQIIKEMRLSGDFFLESRAVMQHLANTKLGIESLMNKAAKLDTPEFLDRELLAIKDGLITPKTHKFAGAEERVASQILPGTGGKVVEKLKAVSKKVLEIEEKRMDWGYNRLQRKFKVNDYWAKREAWKGSHPGYTDEALREAGQKIASEINAVYKGLNYKVIGYSGSSRDWMRLAMLAPDYTMSKIELVKEAVKKNPAAITHILTTVLGSYAVMTQGLNVMLTGHSTFSNEEGHKLDVQVRPGLYIKTLPDWTYDVAKAVTQPVNEVVGKAGFWAQPFYTAYALKEGSWDGIWELVKTPIPVPLTEMVAPDLNALERVLVALGILTKSGSAKKSGSGSSKSKSSKGRSLSEFKR